MTTDELSGAAVPEVVADLVAAIGQGGLQTTPEAIIRVLKDNSWLSPVHTEEFDRRREAKGPTLGVVAVVAPTTVQEVRDVVEVAVRHRTPITPRGGGTSNFGLVTPEHGGVVLDLRGLKGPCEVIDDEITAPAGVLQGVMERAARDAARELTVLTTTYASATIGGWIAGGHVGLGSGVHGSVWDGNIRRSRIITAQDRPEVRTLEGDDLVPLLHTFGTVAVAVDVTMRTTVVHDWLEAVAFFSDFWTASSFVREVSLDTTFRHRVVTAQEEALMPSFRALSSVMQDGAGVLMIIDSEQQDDVKGIAARHGGVMVPWQLWDLGALKRPSIASMVYGHRMLWVKRSFPDAAFLHAYFDPEDADRDASILKEHFGDDVLVEMKYIRSGWMRSVLGYEPDGTLPASVVTIRNADTPGTVTDLMRFCDSVGIRYQNPHTSVLEDNGMFPDLEPIVRMKSEVDPYNLLNRGKLRASAVDSTNARR